MDYKLLLRKLMLADYDWRGDCELGKDVDDPTLGVVKFSEAEMAELNTLRSDAHTDWLLRSLDPAHRDAWDATAASFTNS